MSSQERLRLENDTRLYPEDLLVGAQANDLNYLEPRQSATLALNPDTGERLPPVKAIFASRSMDVSTFCAAVYSRDGWSGWHTYKQPDGDGELYEFFAAPFVLRAAVLAMRSGVEGSVYRVKPDGFSPYEPIPGQFVATDEVQVEDEYRVNIMDMRQPVASAAHLHRATQARPAFTRQVQPRLNLEFLLLRARRPDVPAYDDLPPDQMAAELRANS